MHGPRGKIQNHVHGNPDGFTLIELVIVLLVLAVISVFIAQKVGNVTSMNAAAFRKKLAADIRYAQNIAMTRNRRTRVYFNGIGLAPVIAPAAGYAVGCDGSAAGDCSAYTAVADPAGSGNLAVTLNTGSFAGITVTPGTTSCLEYDSLGRPYDCSANLNICSATAAGPAYQVRANGTAVGSPIAVTAETGAVN